MATVTQTYTIHPTNVTLADPNGRTVLVGGAGALSVDDDHATYAEKVWANHEAENTYYGMRHLMLTLDIAPPPVPAGATNVSYNPSYTYEYRGFREDYHGRHETGYLNLPPHPSGAQRNWALGELSNTKLSPDPSGVAGVVTRSTSESVDWSVGLIGAELQVDFNSGDPYHDVTGSPQCRVRISYIAFNVSVTYDEPPAPEPVASGTFPRGPRLFPVKSQQASPRRGPGSYY